MLSRIRVNEILLTVGSFEVSQSEWNVLMRFGVEDLNEIRACKAILEKRSFSIDVSKPMSNLRSQFQLENT